VTDRQGAFSRASLRRVLRESAVFVAIAALAGFAYTGFLSKGWFAPDAGGRKAASAPATISLTEAQKLFETGAAMFIDARPAFDFGLGHIRGAVNVPLKDFTTTHEILNLIPREQPLVTYCDGEECNSSVMLASKLDSLGYRNVRVFFGGWKEWSSHKLPVE
jgi:rhodanese-related sulfurtransferase